MSRGLWWREEDGTVELSLVYPGEPVIARLFSAEHPVTEVDGWRWVEASGSGRITLSFATSTPTSAEDPQTPDGVIAAVWDVERREWVASEETDTS